MEIFFLFFLRFIIFHFFFFFLLFFLSLFISFLEQTSRIASGLRKLGVEKGHYRLHSCLIRFLTKPTQAISLSFIQSFQ